MTQLICHDPIDPAMVSGLIGSERAGSVVCHYALVKEMSGEGGTTVCIEYAAVGDATAELGEIAAELKEAWEIEDVVIIRRVGCLGIGDIISLVATSSPNSEDAFAACRHGIGRLKKMRTIRKNEAYCRG